MSVLKHNFIEVHIACHTFTALDSNHNGTHIIPVLRNISCLHIVAETEYAGIASQCHAIRQSEVVLPFIRVERESTIIMSQLSGFRSRLHYLYQSCKLSIIREHIFLQLIQIIHDVVQRSITDIVITLAGCSCVSISLCRQRRGIRIAGQIVHHVLYAGKESIELLHVSNRVVEIDIFSIPTLLFSNLIVLLIVSEHIINIVHSILCHQLFIALRLSHISYKPSHISTRNHMARSDHIRHQILQFAQSFHIAHQTAVEIYDFQLSQFVCRQHLQSLGNLHYRHTWPSS